MPLSRVTRRYILGIAIAVPVAALIALPDGRQAAWRTLIPRADATETTVALEAVLADRKLYVTMPGGEVKTYDVAIGTPAYPTPTGQFTIRRIVWNPGWVPPNSKWARGKRARGPQDPGNPMKVAKIFFKQPDYYIHGTGHVESLGTAASHGCLRMHPDEVAELGATLMQAGSVAHDWDWVKSTLRVGETRTINLKQPVRMTVLPSRPQAAPADPAAAVPAAAPAIPVGGQGPGDTTVVVDSLSRPR